MDPEIAFVIAALIDRLFRIGHAEAALELRRGWTAVRGFTDGLDAFLNALETVRGHWAHRLEDQDRECLRNIEAEVRAQVLRTASSSA